MQPITKTRVTTIAIGLISLLSVQSALAAKDCTTYHGTSGLRACVDFDNLETTPQVDVHHEFSFDANGIPTINLLRGDDGVTHAQWRVWSEDNTSAAGDIDKLEALADHAVFVSCLDGPRGTNGASCGCADADGDGDVDLRDAAVFQNRLRR